MSTRIATLVGATGGAGTTRLTVEAAALLGATGRSVAVFDAALQTQGLASYVDGPVEADATALLTGDADLDDALVPLALDLPGTVSVCPARAPFERLARAKTAGAANRFEQQLAAAAISHDAVLVDTPPIGGNQAIAAVEAADRVGLVAPDSHRGNDGLALAQDRLADIGHSASVVIANRADGGPLQADVSIPESSVMAPQECPAVPDEAEFRSAMAEAVEALLGFDIDIGTDESGRLSGLLG